MTNKEIIERLEKSFLFLNLIEVKGIQNHDAITAIAQQIKALADYFTEREEVIQEDS